MECNIGSLGLFVDYNCCDVFKTVATSNGECIIIPSLALSHFPYVRGCCQGWEFKRM